MKNYKEFADKIGVKFNNIELLQQAFTHRSFVNENSGHTTGHNERLEFLGDAVLELVSSVELFRKYQDKPEGELTAYRAALVNTVSLSETADEVGVNDYLLLSKGESKDTGKARQSILADTFEAIIGAIYMDQGYEASEKFIADTLFPKIDGIVENKLYRDAKSLIQEKAQEVLSVTPHYEVTKEEGPDHNKMFTVGVFFDKELIAEGQGQSKQEAQQEAAAKALEEKGWE